MNRIVLISLSCVYLGLSACDSSRAPSTGEAPPPARGSQDLEPIRIGHGGKVSAQNQKTSDLMYHILAAEIAAQRGDWKTAINQYLKSADLTDDVTLVQRATELAFLAQDYSGALTASKRWAELKTANPKPYEYLAILYLRNKQPQESVAAVRNYFSRLTAEPAVRFLAIVALFSQEADRAGAFQVVKLFFAEYGANTDALFAYARFALHANQHAEALRSIDIVLQHKPRSAEAQLVRARSLIKLGKHSQAIQEMHKVVKAFPKEQALRIGLARLLAEAKRFPEAREQFEAVLQVKPADPDILFALALLSLESKNYPDAERYFKIMVDVGARSTEAFYYLGLIAEERRRFDAAIAWLSKVRQGDRAIDAHIRIAVIMSKKGDVEAARRFLYQLSPRTKALEVRLYLTEADILNRVNRWKDALEVVNSALNTNPGQHDLLYARAMLAEKLDRLDLVEQDLALIIKADPKNSQALNALGYTLADRTQRYQEAHVYIKRAFELSPDQAAIIDSMGWVEYRLGNYAEAIKYLKKAFELDNNAEIAAHLGEVLWKSGDKVAAARIWEQGLKLDKANKVLQATLKRLKQ